MLQSIKRSIASPWLRYSLFGVLIASFGVWGIGDVLRRLVSPTAEVLAEGEGFVIDRQDFARHWLRATAQYRAQGLTNEQLLAGPLPNLVLDRMLAQALLQNAAKDLKLVVPPSVLQKAIAQEPSFAGEDGRFASWRFIAFLRQAGFSEQAYLQELQANLIQSSLLQSLSFQLSLPTPFLRELLAARREQRDIQILHLPLPPLRSLPDPGDEALKDFMQKEQALFRLPEYRRFAYATIALNIETSLDDALVRAYYEERKQELAEPEKRSFLQLFFAEEVQAQSAESMLKSGKTMREVAAKFSVSPLSIEEQAQDELPDAQIAKSLFAMTEAGESVVVQGGLGWYVLRLESIKPSNVPSFDAVRPALTTQLLQERTAKRYAETVSQAEDMLFAGSSLAEVAETLDLTIETTPLLDDKAFLTDGTKVPRLWRRLSDTEERDLLALGFELQSEREVSQAFEIDNKEGRSEAFFLELSERQEARQADLEQAREAVLAVYRDLTRREQQQKRANSLADAIRREGTTREGWKRLVQREGLSSSNSTLERNAQLAETLGWSADVLDALFKAQKGDVLVARGEGGDAVVRVNDVRRPAVNSFSDQEIKEFAAMLARETALPMSSYRQALQDRAKLRLDEEAFAAFVASGLTP